MNTNNSANDISSNPISSDNSSVNVDPNSSLNTQNLNTPEELENTQSNSNVNKVEDISFQNNKLAESSVAEVANTTTSMPTQVSEPVVTANPDTLSSGVGVELPTEGELQVSNTEPQQPGEMIKPSVPVDNVVPETATNESVHSSMQPGVEASQPAQDLNMLQPTKNSGSIVVPVLLLLFLYPVGLLYAWFGTKWNIMIKILISIPFLLMLLFLIQASIVPIS